MTSFGEAQTLYINKADIQSRHTMDAYSRAIDLFMDYLNDKGFSKQLPIQTLALPTAADYPIEKLTAADQPILQYFVEWLQTPSEHDRRPYADSTVELRLAGVQRWFEFMQESGYLPDVFSLEVAIECTKNRRTRQTHTREAKAVEVIQDLSALLRYYDVQQPPKSYKPNTDRFRRWELTRLRNAALIKTLAESGGQISTILEINADAVMGEESTVQIEVRGKSQHTYHITLKSSLKPLRNYLQQRVIPESYRAATPIFVSHDKRYDGTRMSRVIAWRVIQRAATAVGMESVSPHDFRHWRAQQLLEEGHSLDDLKDLLGHRSINTVRVYYGHLIEE
jgi:site-specific recombinase XerD